MSIPQLFAAASGSSQLGQVGPEALSDDLLLYIFSLVPERTAAIAKGGTQITCRSATLTLIELAGIQLGDAQVERAPDRFLSSSCVRRACCRGGLERVCRRWRRLSQSLLCRRMQLKIGKCTADEATPQTCDEVGAQRILRQLGGRLPAELEVHNAGLCTFQGWRLLASNLLPTVHRHVHEVT
jgi:hypothetical protein